MSVSDSEDNVLHMLINTDGDLLTIFHTERSQRNRRPSLDREIDEFVEKVVADLNQNEETTGAIENLENASVYDDGDLPNNCTESSISGPKPDANELTQMQGILSPSNTSSLVTIFENNSYENSSTSFDSLITIISKILLYLSNVKSATSQTDEHIIGKASASEISFSKFNGWIWMQAEICNLICVRANALSTSETMQENISKFFSELQTDASMLRMEITALKELVKRFMKLLKITNEYIEKLEKIGFKKFTQATSLINKLNSVTSQDLKEPEASETWDSGILDYTEEFIHFDSGGLFIKTNKVEQHICLINSNEEIKELLKASRIVHHGFRNFLTSSNSSCNNLCQLLEPNTLEVEINLKQMFRHFKIQIRTTEFMYPAQQTMLHASIKKMKAIVAETMSLTKSLKSNIKSNLLLFNSSIGKANIDTFEGIIILNTQFTLWRNTLNLSFTLKIESSKSSRFTGVKEDSQKNSPLDVMREIMESETQVHMMLVENDFENLYKSRINSLLTVEGDLKLFDVQLCRSKIQTAVFDCYHIIEIMKGFYEIIHEINMTNFTTWDSSPNRNIYNVNLWLYISSECLHIFRSHCKLDSIKKKEMKFNFERCFDELIRVTKVAKRSGAEYMKTCSLIEMLMDSIENSIVYENLNKQVVSKQSKAPSPIHQHNSDSGEQEVKICLNGSGLVIKIEDSGFQFSLLEQQQQVQLFYLLFHEVKRTIHRILHAYTEVLSFLNKQSNRSKYSRYNILLLTNRVKQILKGNDEITQLELIVLKQSFKELHTSVSRLHAEIVYLNPFRRNKLISELNVSKQLVDTCFLKTKDISTITHISNIIGGAVEIPVREMEMIRNITLLCTSTSHSSLAMVPTQNQNVSYQFQDLFEKSKELLFVSDTLMKYLRQTNTTISSTSEISKDKVLHYEAISIYLLILMLELNLSIEKNALKSFKGKQKQILNTSTQIIRWMTRNVNHQFIKVEEKVGNITTYNNQQSALQIQQLYTSSESESDKSSAHYITLNWDNSKKYLLFSDFSSDLNKFSEIQLDKQEDTITRTLELLKSKTDFIKQELAKIVKTFKEFYGSISKLNQDGELLSNNQLIIEQIYSNFKQYKQRMEFIYLRMESLQAKLQIGLNLTKMMMKPKHIEHCSLERKRIQKYIYEMPKPLQIRINY